MILAGQVDKLLLKLSAAMVDDVKAAFQASVNVGQVVDDFLRAYPEGTSLTPVQARVWAKHHVVPNNRLVNVVLDKAQSVGYVLGTDFANAAVVQVKNDKAVTPDPAVLALSFSWDGWSPGHRAAEALVRPSGGLARLLANRGATISGLDATSIDRIGTRLADGLAGGWSADRIASALGDVLSDPQRALTVAVTEMAGANSVASLDVYSGLGLEQVEWFAIDGCELCEGNANNGPVGVGDVFPSGDSAPPAHPNCRCCLLPWVEGDSVSAAWEYSDGDGKSVSADAAKAGVPDRTDVMRALARLEILPNPNDPTLKDEMKWVESPWKIVPAPTINPNLWDDALVKIVNLGDLYGTDPFLKRKRVEKHILAMGQALSPMRSYALIAEVAGKLIIVDGHHRLMASWLLGEDTAPVYMIEVK